MRETNLGVVEGASEMARGGVGVLERRQGSQGESEGLGRIDGLHFASP